MIGAARTALASILTDAGLRVSAFVPDRITPPLAVLEPSGDWVVSGDTFGSFRIGFDVTLIVQTAANEIAKKSEHSAGSLKTMYYKWRQTAKK